MSLVQIPFHDTAINAIETDEGVHIAIKPVAEALGLDWSAQYRRLQRQPWAGVAVMAIPEHSSHRLQSGGAELLLAEFNQRRKS